MPKQRKPGKLWPYVRPLIWDKAQQLFQEDQAKTMGADFQGITATHKELRENGYFHTARALHCLLASYFCSFLVRKCLEGKRHESFLDRLNILLYGDVNKQWVCQLL